MFQIARNVPTLTAHRKRVLNQCTEIQWLQSIILNIILCCVISFWYDYYITLQYMQVYIYIYIYDPGSRFATTPPPPMVWSQNLRFAAFCMKTRYLQGAWLARSANLQICRISCNQPSENVLFAMFRLRRRGVVPLHRLLCQIIIWF